MPGRVRSLLLRAEVRRAGRLSKCGRNKRHVINKGDVRFVVTTYGAAAKEKGYCDDCARAMLEQAGQDLDDLRKELEAETA